MAHLPDLTELHERDYGRILASVIRVARDFDLAEDAVQEAFEQALEQWADSPPDNPTAWLTSTAQRRAIDRLRRQKRFDERRDALTQTLQDEGETKAREDDSLRLIFTCCHPALALEARIALTLRTLGGLTTEEIARAFLVPPATLAQRLVRAKNKIRTAGIPYQVPEERDLPERLSGVMHVLYLVFNEGYSASFGEQLLRRDLCREGIRLARLLTALLGSEPEPKGLLALMLLHDSRRDARADADGELIVLDDQDRTAWDQTAISEGCRLVEEALALRRPPGPYALQAAIAALHAQAPTAADTDWRQIAALYAILSRVAPSPVVELNRAVAVALADDLELGLSRLRELDQSGALGDYHLLPAAMADLLRRQGKATEAAEQYRRAIALAQNGAERRYLERRLASLTKK